MLHIAICDDEPVHASKIEKLTEQFLAAQGLDAAVELFSCGEGLLASDTPFDIVLLDVDMKEGLDGIETARLLRRKNDMAILIYISAFIEFAPAGYEVNAFRYLLKNDLDRNFSACMSSALEQLNREEEHWVIHTGGEEIAVYLKDIRYIESTKRIVHYHMALPEGCEYQCYDTLNDLEQTLSAKGFLRVQRSFLINLRHVRSIRNYWVTLDDSQQLKASEKRYAEILQAYTLWKGRI